MRRWFAESVREDGEAFLLDAEQARAVANGNKNLLVMARAGAGKTRTLVAKMVYLIAQCEVPADEIVAFVFNSDARDEINRRMRRMTVDGRKLAGATRATTFHAYANNLVQTRAGENRGEILADSKARGGPMRMQFIQEIVNGLDQRKIYRHFRDESWRVNRGRYFSEADYYEALRSTSYETLDGKMMKSNDEKVIADFLFEHDVKYVYEKTFYTKVRGRDVVRPDFYLPDYGIVWEHWAVTGRESPGEVEKINASGVVGKYREYCENKAWKRGWYGSAAAKEMGCREVIETVAGWAAREEMEERLRRVLLERGVRVEKLPEEERLRRARERQVKKFTKMITQFIDRAEQEYLGDEAGLKSRVAGVAETRVKAFLEIGYAAFSEYVKRLEGDARWGMDFAMLMKRAAEVLDEEKVECEKTRWILIDEYQDFSPLMMGLVNAMRAKNPECNVMAVGDDWQAVNRFAGADGRYYRNFEEYFSEDAERLEVTTNYRCAKDIVANAKRFVTKSMGESGRIKSGMEADGELFLCDCAGVFLENRAGEDRAAERARDDIYAKAMKVSNERSPDRRAVQMLKMVAGIVAENRGKQVLLLHRNNETSFWFVSLREFERRLREVLVRQGVMSAPEFKETVRTMTMHRAKGLEAEVVILLEVDAGVIPMYHPDVALMGIFGESEATALEDQQKLYYVALTRAREKLYVCYRKPRTGDSLAVSSFIENMAGYLMAKR